MNQPKIVVGVTGLLVVIVLVTVAVVTLNFSSSEEETTLTMGEDSVSGLNQSNSSSNSSPSSDIDSDYSAVEVGSQSFGNPGEDTRETKNVIITKAAKMCRKGKKEVSCPKNGNRVKRDTIVVGVTGVGVVSVIVAVALFTLKPSLSGADTTRTKTSEKSMGDAGESLLNKSGDFTSSPHSDCPEVVIVKESKLGENGNSGS